MHTLDAGSQPLGNSRQAVQVARALDLQVGMEAGKQQGSPLCSELGAIWLDAVTARLGFIMKTSKACQLALPGKSVCTMCNVHLV